MGTQERRAREAENTKRVLLDAALKVFSMHGYEATSMRKIAAEAEYSAGLIYLYFKDKNQLLLELQERIFERFAQFIREAREACIGGPREEFRAGLNAYIEFGLSYPDEYDLMFTFRAPMEGLEDYREWGAGSRGFGDLRESVGRLMEGGYLEAGDPEIKAYVIWSTLHGMVSLSISGRYCIFEKERRDKMIQYGLEELMNHVFAD